LAQLERADEMVRLKRELAHKYFERLSHLPLKFHREAPNTVHAYWMVSALVRNESERDRLRHHLAAAGIETRPLFFPLHTMGLHASRFKGKTVAEDIAARGLNLPSWPDIGEKEFELVCRAIDDFF